MTDASAEASASDAGAGVDVGPLSVESVATCDSQPAPVTSSVGRFKGGGGSLAYKHAGGVWVLPAKSQVAVEVAPNDDPWDFSIDDAFLMLIEGGSNQTLSTIEIATQTRRTLATSYWLFGGLCAHWAFWWATPNGQSYTLHATPADGSGTTTDITTQSWDPPIACDGGRIAWPDSAGVIWTMPVTGGTPTSHATLPFGTTFTLQGDTIYFAQMGVKGANNFTPFAIVSEPLDGGAVTTIATSLPPNYPAQGSPGNGPSNPVLGTKRVFWSEFWGNGGAGPNGSLINWELRAVVPTGGNVASIDSFTYTPQSTTTGTAPELAADGTAVYWTSEGTLMRLCE